MTMINRQDANAPQNPPAPSSGFEHPSDDKRERAYEQLRDMILNSAESAQYKEQPVKVRRFDDAEIRRVAGERGCPPETVESLLNDKTLFVRMEGDKYAMVG